MCACDPPCQPLEGDWPTDQCPNPECTDETPRKPVGAHDIGGGLGLTFHCGTCPTRWYTPYTFARSTS